MNNQSLIFIIVYFISIFLALLLGLNFVYSIFFQDETIIQILKRKVKSK